ASFWPFEIGINQVRDKHEYGYALDERADGNDPVEGFPPWTGLVGVDTARHSENPGKVHHVECHVKPEQEKPEMELTQRFVEHCSCDFRIPIIKGGKKREEDSTDDHIVKVRHDEVGEAKLPIK